MIIVEGPDGAGKTTLIRHLTKATGFPVAPRVVSKDTEAMVDLTQWVEDNVRGGFQQTIFDRHRLISEPIYGPILRSTLQPKFDDPRWLISMTRLLYGCRPIMIYCLPPFEVVWENIMNDPDNRVFHGAVQKFRLIYEGYKNKMVSDKATYDRTWYYDYSDPYVHGDVMAGVIAGYIKKESY